jgi:hypothetical protein
LNASCVSENRRGAKDFFRSGDPIVKPFSVQGLGSRHDTGRQDDAKLLQVASQNVYVVLLGDMPCHRARAGEKADKAPVAWRYLRDGFPETIEKHRPFGTHVFHSKSNPVKTIPLTLHRS